MTLRNVSAAQCWIAALDQRKRRVWTQLVCVLHAQLVSGAMCDSMCVSDIVGDLRAFHTAQHNTTSSLWRHVTSSTRPLLAPMTVFRRLLCPVDDEPTTSLQTAPCCAGSLLTKSQSRWTQWELTLHWPAEGAKTSIQWLVNKWAKYDWSFTTFNLISSIVFSLSFAVITSSYRVSPCWGRVKRMTVMSHTLKTAFTVLQFAY